MKKILFGFILVLVLSISLVHGVQGVYASTAEINFNAPNLQIPDNVFTFGELGYNERIMLGPYDSTRVVFSLPPTWALQDGGKITLRYSFAASGGSSSDPKLGGVLLLYFNDVVIDTIYLDQPGQFSKEFTIPASALKSVSGDSRHYITLFYDASINCEDENYSSSLVIGDESEVSFVYANMPPAIDLSKFPQPIYQPSAIETSPAVIVIPDHPTALELQAALSVSAGIGSLTLGDLQPELLTIGNLTEEQKLNSNLIFVGLPNSMSVLQNVSMPIPFSSGSFGASGAKPEDGVIQMSLSPWNQTKVLMFISGDTEKGLLKASAIVGSGQIFTSGRPDVSIVSDVNVSRLAADVPDIRTFSELGYQNVTLGDQGDQYASYLFYVSAEQAAATGAYIDLTSLRSDLLNNDQSGISVTLNGEPITSLGFDQETETVATKRINLLPNLLHRGSNLLEVFAELRPKNDCHTRDLNSNWVTLSDSSVINTPSDTANSLVYNVNLQDFPVFLLTEDNLSNVAFILPENDPSAWSQASGIANFLGNNGNLVVSDLVVLFGNQISDEVLKERNIILLGQPSSLPVFEQLNDSLPAPFELGSNEAIQPAMLVNYRLLPDVSVGYLELLTSPWNSDRSVLAVAGNTGDGVSMASTALLDDTLAEKLIGNFAIVYGNQVVATDTRLGQAKESIVGELPIAVTVTPTSADSDGTPSNPSDISAPPSRSNWILPVLIVISLLVVVIAIVVLRNQLAERRMGKGKASQEKEE